MKDFCPYFDQEEPEVPVVGLISDLDVSQPYELDAVAVFKSKPGYLVVEVSGCSCWPDRGGTKQVHCARRRDVQKALRNVGIYYKQNMGLTLFLQCQERNWKIQS